ncbi:MAG: ABC transporter permease [Thermomicrobiales bacterium]|nr:ABC transporter permease [Thermomicrobiales bacterium]
MASLPSTTSSGATSRFRNIRIDPVILTFIVLLLLWGFSIYRNEGFRTVNYSMLTLRTAAFLGIVAAGQTLVILMGGIDLSVAAVITMTGVICGNLMTQIGQAGGILVTLLIAILVGVCNGLGVTVLRLPPLVMTLATLSIIQGVLLVYNAGKPVSGKSPFLEFWAKEKLLGIPTAFWVLVAVTLFCVVLLHFTSFGRGIYAIGNNPRASFISGIPTTAIQIATYAMCSFFAAITGLLLLGRTGYSSKTAGDPYMLMSIAAVVIGGTSIIGGRGKIVGTIGGALVMTILLNLLTVENIDESVRMMIQGGLILALLIAYAVTED